MSKEQYILCPKCNSDQWFLSEASYVFNCLTCGHTQRMADMAELLKKMELAVGGKIEHCHSDSIDDRIKDEGKKCYVLIISRFFPKNHPKAGEHTHFFESIENGTKIHTIRENYELWRKRISEVNEGNAFISRRYWSGKPFNSKQVEYDRIYKANIQRVFLTYDWSMEVSIDSKEYFKSDYNKTLWENDGLSYDDFEDWFFPPKMKDDEFSGGIIHFTDFKY